jgi:thiamine-monophosphate kinase
MRRDAARPGEAVAVSGIPGGSAAGLRLIEEGREGEPGAPLLIERAHRRPVARVALGRAALAAGVRCAIDVSDGLLQDAGHVAERSGAGVEIELEALPVSPFAVELFGLETARDLALGGGEDYELVLAGDEATLSALAEEHPLTLIGRVTEDHAGEAWAVDASGARYMPPSAGWDQLAR